MKQIANWAIPTLLAPYELSRRPVEKVVLNAKRYFRLVARDLAEKLRAELRMLNMLSPSSPLYLAEKSAELVHATSLLRSFRLS